MSPFVLAISAWIFWARFAGHINSLPAGESSHDRASRHTRIAERRSGTIIMVHRGASSFAPENTLEAYAAAMDYGADGCEVDIRCTSNGHLVLFHDDMLDRLTNGFGTVNQLTYAELISLRPRFVYGTADSRTRLPTLGALLVLAQKRQMLLHLDIKEPGLDGDIARMLDVFDVWDHVVAANAANAGKLLSNPKLKLLKYKAPGLFEGRLDVDPVSVRDALARPGQMIIVDDPRVAARELNRPPYRPLSIPKGLRRMITDSSVIVPRPSSSNEPIQPFNHIRRLIWRLNPRAADELVRLLHCDSSERTEPDGNANYQRRRTERIIERAWAAQRLGEIGHRSPEVIRLLEHEVANRSLHRDWMYHGLDGAMAARALGMLQSVDSAPVLIDAFMRIDPLLKKVANPEYGQYPLSWTDFRTKMTILPALGEIRCDAAKSFLKSYLAMDEAKAKEIAPLLFEDATRAYLRQELAFDELTALLTSRHSAVRGTAVLEFIDHPSSERKRALSQAAPWALALPGAKEAR